MKLVCATHTFIALLIFVCVLPSIPAHSTPPNCPAGGGQSNGCPTVETEKTLEASTISTSPPPFVYTSRYFSAADGGAGVLYALNGTFDGTSCTAEVSAPNHGTVIKDDESVPGSGLGLAIVRDIAGLYGGSLTLDSGPLGGLEVRLGLPAIA